MKGVAEGRRLERDDLALTWEDMVLLRTLFDATDANQSMGALTVQPMTREYYEYLLREFNEQREKEMKTEDAMKELDEKIKKVSEAGTWDGIVVDKYLNEIRGGLTWQDIRRIVKIADDLLDDPQGEGGLPNSHH